VFGGVVRRIEETLSEEEKIKFGLKTPELAFIKPEGKAQKPQGSVLKYIK
jgi:hypothetical protein